MTVTIWIIGAWFTLGFIDVKGSAFERFVIFFWVIIFWPYILGDAISAKWFQ